MAIGASRYSGSAGAKASVAKARPHRPLVRFSELSARGVVAVLANEARLSFAFEQLRAIVAVPTEAEELLATLAAFLNSHGQRLAASGASRIHRHTLSKRLNRLELLLGRSLDDPQTRVDLWVALQAYSDAEP